MFKSTLCLKILLNHFSAEDKCLAFVCNWKFTYLVPDRLAESNKHSERAHNTDLTLYQRFFKVTKLNEHC